MRRNLVIAFGMVLGLALIGRTADAQWMYPGGYGNYGWGGWGADPASGYMAGLGSYARGQGVYEVEDAKAQAINLDTMLKWNRALRARQRTLAEEQRAADAQRAADRDARVDRLNLEDGTTLNNLLAQIYDFDPAATKSSRARTPIPAGTVHDIPFAWNTEALTLCIDQMTGDDALPPSLSEPRFAAERDALRSAVRQAIKEDTRGDVSSATKKRVSKAIADFREKFAKTTPDFDQSGGEANEYFVTLASLTKMLNDPSMKKILAELGKDKEIAVGELIAFMQSYNLRFAPATTERQIQIYRGLVPLFTQILDEVDNQPAGAKATDRNGKELQSAAKQTFKGMKWDQLKAHDNDQ